MVASTMYTEDFSGVIGELKFSVLSNRWVIRLGYLVIIDIDWSGVSHDVLFGFIGADGIC